MGIHVHSYENSRGEDWEEGWVATESMVEGFSSAGGLKSLVEWPKIWAELMSAAADPGTKKGGCALARAVRDYSNILF